MTRSDLDRHQRQVIRLEIERQELAQAFKASQISTPLSLATSVDIRSTCAEALEILDSGGFDQAPVVSGPAWVGWVQRTSLEAMTNGERVKSAFHHLSATAIISERASIAEVLKHLARAGFVFTASGDGLVGFVTPSDLERHAARNHFFVLVAGVEMLLSELVRCYYSLEDVERIIPDDKLPVLEPGDTRRPKSGSLRDRYLAAKSRHSETHPVEYLYLGQLKDLVVDLGDSGRISSWTPRVGTDLNKVVDIRPDVTHPTRSLIARRDAKALLNVAVAAEDSHLALSQYLLEAQESSARD